VSEVEKELVESIEPSSNVVVVSNIHKVSVVQEANESRKGIVFVGSFNHHPNELGLRWFFKEIWSQLSDETKSEGISIVGQNPPSWLKKLENDNIKVLGWVESSEIYVRNAKVSIAPLTVGAGVKGKVGEAISNFTPVIGTSVSLEGMGLENEVSCLLRDDPLAFANAIDNLVGNEQRRKSIAESAASALDAKFSAHAARMSVEKALDLGNIG
jgi:glycosyltransferase involved in cell wall biosynthesis